MQSICRAQVTISGRVQGVGFRYTLRSRASSLGVSGWARNRLDGKVEAAFEGPREHVELLLRWCRQGPSAAYVDEVEVEWQEPKGEHGFAIR
ncbi:MAG: acylphosphatase [Gaiellaceae bacterium]|jgi:acylphosphatase